MDFDLQARDGADVQMGDAHGSELAVDGLDGPAEGALRGPHCSARVCGAMVSFFRGTRTPPPVARMTASSGAPLSGAPLSGAPLSGAPLSGAPLSGAPLSAPCRSRPTPLRAG